MAKRYTRNEIKEKFGIEISPCTCGYCDGEPDRIIQHGKGPYEGTWRFYGKYADPKSHRWCAGCCSNVHADALEEAAAEWNEINSKHIYSLFVSHGKHYAGHMLGLGYIRAKDDDEAFELAKQNTEIKVANKNSNFWKLWSRRGGYAITPDRQIGTYVGGGDPVYANWVKRGRNHV
jgi:hypothetical protein